MKNILKLITFFLIVHTSCISTNNNSGKSANLIPKDSLKFFSLYNDMVNSTVFNHDTLKFITTDLIAYFPLGKFENIEELANKFKIINIDEEFQYPNNDSTMQGFTLYNLIFKNSRIKVFVSTGKVQVNIVSGVIADNNITLTNSIEVGQSKSEVIRKFYSRLPDNYEEINVIELDSGLEGIWHYYNFNNNLLTSIKFDTDYQFKK